MKLKVALYKLPNFKDMKMYFNGPAIYLSNNEDYYYVFYKDKKSYSICVYDQTLEFNNCGYDIGNRNDKSPRYQADEFSDLSKSEFEDILYKCDFGHSDLDKIYKKFKKLKGLKNEYKKIV